MTTASPELCQELQRVSGWVDTSSSDGVERYTLGFLTRKLPAGYFVTRVIGNHPVFVIGHINEQPAETWEPPIMASTPEDALCKLSIELFKQGILKHE